MPLERCGRPLTGRHRPIWRVSTRPNLRDRIDAALAVSFTPERCQAKNVDGDECSLPIGHTGNHTAYCGHIVKGCNYLTEWSPSTSERLRESVRFLEAVRFSLAHERKYPHRAMPWTADDMQRILTLLDTQQTALRALVERLRQLAETAKVAVSRAGVTDSQRLCLSERAHCFEYSATELERVLTPEQS